MPLIALQGLRHGQHQAARAVQIFVRIVPGHQNLVREHRGHLYLGGILNNRIGRYKLANADPDFVQYDRRWRKA